MIKILSKSLFLIASLFLLMIIAPRPALAATYYPGSYPSGLTTTCGDSLLSGDYYITGAFTVSSGCTTAFFGAVNIFADAITVNGTLYGSGLGGNYTGMGGYGNDVRGSGGGGLGGYGGRGTDNIQEHVGGCRFSETNGSTAPYGGTGNGSYYFIDGSGLKIPILTYATAGAYGGPGYYWDIKPCWECSYGPVYYGTYISGANTPFTVYNDFECPLYTTGGDSAVDCHSPSTLNWAKGGAGILLDAQNITINGYIYANGESGRNALFPYNDRYPGGTCDSLTRHSFGYGAGGGGAGGNIILKANLALAIYDNSRLQAVGGSGGQANNSGVPNCVTSGDVCSVHKDYGGESGGGGSGGIIKLSYGTYTGGINPLTIPLSSVAGGSRGSWTAFADRVWGNGYNTNDWCSNADAGSCAQDGYPWPGGGYRSPGPGNGETGIVYARVVDITPPTAIISGLDLIRATATNYTATADDNSGISRIDLYVSPTGAQNWTYLGGCDYTTSCIKPWTPTTSGTYYVVSSALDTKGNWCTGNPWGGATSCGAASQMVVTVDANPPAVSVDGALTYWSSIPQEASVVCSDTGGSGCANSTYRLKSYAANPVTCPSVYSMYTSTNPQPVNVRQWVCATAKDNVGNTGYSPAPVEFKIVTVAPPQPSSIEINNITELGCIVGSSINSEIVKINWLPTANPPVSYVEISEFSDFHSYYRKNVSSTSTSTTASNGFNGYVGVSGPLALLPEPVTYYVRLWNGLNGPSLSFSIPPCAGLLSAKCFPGNPTIASFSWDTQPGAPLYIISYTRDTVSQTDITVDYSGCNPPSCTIPQTATIAQEVTTGNYKWEKLKTCTAPGNCNAGVDGPAFICNPPPYLKTTGGDVHSNQ